MELAAQWDARGTDDNFGESIIAMMLQSRNVRKNKLDVADC